MKDHYCVYVNAEEYRRITTIGVVIALLMSVVGVAIIVTRDFLKLWTPTNKVAPIPARQMTTMTAGYAGATMPVVAESNAGPGEVKA
jgi:lipoate-protein ligase B